MLQEFFEAPVPAKTGPLDYKIYHSSGKLYHDPYAFLPRLARSMPTYLIRGPITSSTMF